MSRRTFTFFLFAYYFTYRTQAALVTRTITKDFLFGIGSSAYQVEGAWDEEGKGENIWDKFTHEKPNAIADASSADISCNSYYKYAEDVALVKELGVNYYRFSISWSRILPHGFSYKINQDAISYYNNLIDLLLTNNITPMVTMYHWDTPQPIAELGGFASSLTIGWFEEYARVLFENFGDRVKLWLTFNEPYELCKEGFGLDLDMAPSDFTGYGDYMCAHNVLKAHARVYHIYQEMFKSTQQGKISISLSSYWYEPGSSATVDVEAAERAREFTLAWFADPIYHAKGDYPDSMRKTIASRSKREGFGKSRLPTFSKEEIDYIKGTSDFFALNHYSTKLAADSGKIPIGSHSYQKDLGVKLWYDENWKGSPVEWLKVVPWGFRNLLKWIKRRYGDVEVVITENGFGDRGEINDQERIDYFKGYLDALLDAMYEDKVNVTAYTAWSLMDNFEWKDGYKYKFGLYHVDFSDPEKLRKPKSSARFYKDLILNRTFTLDKSHSAKTISNLWLLLLFVVIAKRV